MEVIGVKPRDRCEWNIRDGNGYGGWVEKIRDNKRWVISWRNG